MIYCKRCLYPANHPLGLAFDAEGICTGCRVHEEKDGLDWTARGARLARLFDRHRDRTGSRYDCVVPVSGGKDSFFIVDTVKRAGLNPLLVTVNRHYNTYAGIFNLEQLRTQAGCDILTLTLKPDSYRRLVAFSLRRLGSIHWPYLAASTVFPVQVAVARRIPLIVWGAHQGLEQVGMFSHRDEVEMTRRYRKEHDLMGLEPEDAVDDADGVSEGDLAPLFYPQDRALAAIGVHGIYLGNYIRWDPKAQHEAMLARYDYCVAPQLRTFDTYADVDCQIHSALHDAIKMRKWGYGKVTDHACREIRHGRLTRDQGIALVRRYGAAGEGDAAGFAAWLGMTEQDFWRPVDARRDPAIWSQDAGAVWRLSDCVVPAVPAAGEAEAPPPAAAFRTNVPERMAKAPFDGQLLMRGWAPLP